ncbi:hypothetical protein J6590_006780 [Homalodisca vitripennis]|nr:hypothetical protein J6590_006780 [Homalodisca vitripennis]
MMLVVGERQFEVQERQKVTAALRQMDNNTSLFNKTIIPEDAGENANNQCMSGHPNPSFNDEVPSEDAAVSLDSQRMLGNIASSSVSNLSINENNVCDDYPDANIECVEAGKIRINKRNHYRQPDSPDSNRKSKKDSISKNQLT